MTDPLLKEIQDLFLLEAEEILVKSESLLVNLTKEGVDQVSAFDNLKRNMHNLKGSGKVLGFDQLASFAHSIENLLVALAEKVLPITEERVSLLLKCNDAMVSDIQILKADPETKLNQTDLEALLIAAIHNNSEGMHENSSIGSNTNTIDTLVTEVQIVEAIAMAKTAALPEVRKQELEPSLSLLDLALQDPTPPTQTTLTPTQQAPSIPNQRASLSQSTLEPARYPTLETSQTTLRSQQAAEGQQAPSLTKQSQVPLPTPSKTLSNQPAAPQRQTPSALEESIRVPMKKIDDILNAFGEQMIYLSALDHFMANLDGNINNVIGTISSLKKVAFDLQRTTMTLRMVSMKALFSKLERAIRDTAQLTGKNVASEIIGADSEMDKAIVDQLSDPLTHMVRNAVDHGLETPDERIAAGKPAQGKITLSAKREGGILVLEITDDGRGMDPIKIRRKGIEKGLITESQELTERAILDLIFENGFSTREQLSEVSGRGVGMNVVKEMILDLKGSCEIKTIVGGGSTFQINLPLSLSLFNGIIIQVNNERYIVVCSQISEIIEKHTVKTRIMENGRSVVQVRDKIIQMVDLTKILKKPSSFSPKSELNAESASEIRPLKESHRSSILISYSNLASYGFIVDRIIGIQRIAQKPLSPEMTSCPGATGVTILGDGSPAIILDLNSIKTDAAAPFKSEGYLNG